jgi:hypothetical protein
LLLPPPAIYVTVNKWLLAKEAGDQAQNNDDNHINGNV